MMSNEVLPLKLGSTSILAVLLALFCIGMNFAWAESEQSQDRTHNGDNELMKGIRQADVRKVRELLDKGSDPNLPDSEGRIPLPYMVDVLKNTSWEKKVLSNGNTRIRISSLGRYIVTISIIDALLKKGANLPSKPEFRSMEFLCDQDTRVSHDTPLTSAVGTDVDGIYLDAAVEFLLDMCAILGNQSQVNIPEGLFGETPLYKLANSRTPISMMKSFIQAGADVNSKSNFGSTPLMAAASKGYKDKVEMLLASGADASIARKDGDMAIDLARKNNHLEIVTLLKKK